MKRLLMAGLVILGLALPHTARAELKVTVLDIESGPGAGKVAHRMTRALRRQVSNIERMSLTAGKTLAEIKLIFGCTEHPRRAYHKCLAKAGASMQANRVIVGKVRKQGNGYKVVVTLLDVKRPLRPQTVSESIPAGGTSSAALRGLVNTWIQRLFGLDREGQLTLTCSMDGVTVSVMGIDRGQCGTKPSTLKLKPGTHTLRFAKPGFRVSQRLVSISAGKTSRLSVEVTQIPPRIIDRLPPDDRRTPPIPGVTPPKSGTKKDPRLKWKILFYTTVSTGAALLAASIFTGLKVRAYVQDKEDAIRRAIDDPAIPVPDEGNACTGNRGNTEIVSICNSGTRMATVTNALIGLGAVLVAGSGYFMYKAYFAKYPNEERPTPETSAPALRPPDKPHVTVVPTLWERGGGVSATLTF